MTSCELAYVPDRRTPIVGNVKLETQPARYLHVSTMHTNAEPQKKDKH